MAEDQHPSAHPWCRISGPEPNEPGEMVGFDDLTAEGVDLVRMERMDGDSYWLSLEKGKQRQRIEIWVKDGGLRTGTEAEAGESDVSPEHLTERVRLLEAALRECAHDLETYIEAEYPAPTRKTHLSEERRYQRDMQTVVRAWKLLPRKGLLFG